MGYPKNEGLIERIIEYTTAVEDFIKIGQTENGLDKQQKLLTKLLDKNQLYVNLSEIEDEDFGVSAEDKALNRAFYDE